MHVRERATRYPDALPARKKRIFLTKARTENIFKVLPLRSLENSFNLFKIYRILNANLVTLCVFAVAV